MLGKPEAGWVLFQLGSEETAYDLSYLTDVAMEWLTQAIHGLQTLDVFSVHGCCEPGRMVCTVSFWCCYVIFEDDGRSPACQDVRQLHVSMLDFCKQLYRDVSENLEDWDHWLPWEDDAFQSERKKALREKLDTLKSLIQEREENFKEGRCFI